MSPSSRTAAFRQLPFVLVALLVLARDPGAAQLTDIGAKQLSEATSDTGTLSGDTNFGSALAACDFDNDGFDDLAVGMPREDVGPDADAGALLVFFGGPGGLATVGTAYFSQDTPNVPGAAQVDDDFGFALAAADFNGDGFCDLAVGVPGEDADAGAVEVLLGTASGLTASDLSFSEATLGGGESAEAGDRFGAALAAGKINSGSRADLAIGAPGEDLVPVLQDDAGKVYVLLNSGTTPLAQAQQLTQQSAATCSNDPNEAGDNFGRALAVGDLDGDGFADLAAGSPLEDFWVCLTCGDPVVDAGTFTLFHGSSSGATDGECENCESGAFNSAETFALHFGGAFGIGDIDGDGIGDLVVGASGYALPGISQAGIIFAVQGAALSSLGSYTQNDADPNQAGNNDHFGAAIAVADFDADGHADVAVGVPDDSGPGHSRAGEISVLYGTPSGLEVNGFSAFHQDLPPGMPDTEESNDRFGAALAAGDFDGNGTADLAVGVPGEGLSGNSAAGAVNVIYGLDRELGGFGSVRFSTASVNVSESAASQLGLIVREGGAPVAATISRVRSGGTATPGVDFHYTDGSESWSVGDLGPEPFTIGIVDDTLDEANETIVLALQNPTPGLAIGSTPTLTIHILDDDTAGSIAFSAPIFVYAEAQETTAVTVVRTGGQASGTTVHYATADGSAHAGQDYVASSGTLTFGAGETVKSVEIPLLADDAVEAAETFQLLLSSPGGGATLGFLTTAQIVILDSTKIFVDGFESGDTDLWSSVSP